MPPAVALLVAFLVLLGSGLSGAAWGACLGAVANASPNFLQPASFRPSLTPAGALPFQLAQERSQGLRPAPPQGQVRITFVGHATFLIETPGGATAATDYNDYLRPDVTPDIATMNHAHTTHFTNNPDPGIKHLLRGWPYDGKPARHNLAYKDLRVRNVPTNIRNWGGGTEYDGNSIFIFDVADICIAHLGHLHHRLEPGHLADMGRIDVVLVPVDGGYTLNQTEMVEVIRQLKAPLVIPMHYFGDHTLERFLSQLRDTHAVTLSDRNFIQVGRPTLPPKPTVVILPGPH